MAVKPEQRERRLRRTEGAPGQRHFYGRGIYGPEGRRVASLRIARTGRPGGNLPYAIVELAGATPGANDLRAIPLARLVYEDDRAIFLCDLPEMALRSAPAYTGPADWLDMRWTRRLDDYYDGLAMRRPMTRAAYRPELETTGSRAIGT